MSSRMRAVGTMISMRAVALYLGVCIMVANRHLPYEAVLRPLFKAVKPVIETGGYKIYEARK